uniref:HHIP-like protein 2-like n=1 Tax=Saccoglossus kowalevskii TaxID=10224 RepID=A0ABM0MUR5_SACKO|nr:PREDICTED: HHIP-like protein 2-like [Saccoglossus kowalevskii]
MTGYTARLIVLVFSNTGCCTNEEDDVIRGEFKAIKAETASDACSDFIHDILCQRCSPVTSSLFSNDEKSLVPLPGLCASQCNDFYTKCKDAIPHLTSDEAILASLETEKLFCDEVQRTGTEYCYPEMMDTLDTKPEPVKTNFDNCLCLQEKAAGLFNPVVLVSAFDGSGRLFIGQQTGVVLVMVPGQSEPTVFLDIQDQVKTGTLPGDERGFLSMAFHPEYESNGKFYIYYTSDPGTLVLRISEMLVSADPNKADPTTERLLLQIDEPANNHNGGQLLFGLDKYLYVFIGDGGGSGDPDYNGQNKGTFLATGIRIDVDVIGPEKPYGIPPDNPFIDDPEALPELYAYGLRNPWRCSVDRGDFFTGHGKGRILCADVGQLAYEEVDIIQAGGNYGWNGKEGYACYDQAVCDSLVDDILPIDAYDRAIGKCVIGGFVYRGCELHPDADGLYLFGDYSTSAFFKLIENKDTGEWTRDYVCLGDATVCTGDLTGVFPDKILSYGEDENGELYMLATDTAQVTNDGGKVFKLVDPSGNHCSATRKSVGPNHVSRTNVKTDADSGSAVMGISVCLVSIGVLFNLL